MLGLLRIINIMMKRLGILFLLGILTTLSFSFKPVDTHINKTDVDLVHWMTWEEAIQMQKIQARKIIVYVYRDNCTWCDKMNHNTFQNVVIANYLNKNFYPVKFNSETTESVRLENRVYKYTRKSGQVFHEFTAYITNGGMSTPTCVFFNEQSEILQPIPGYKDADIFETIMTYYGDDHYKRTPWSMYMESYVPIVKN